MKVMFYDFAGDESNCTQRKKGYQVVGPSKIWVLVNKQVISFIGYMGYIAIASSDDNIVVSISKFFWFDLIVFNL